ncbi:MAG: hypothetical protein P8X79_03475 [Reinekea sp.]
MESRIQVKNITARWVPEVFHVCTRQNQAFFPAVRFERAVFISTFVLDESFFIASGFRLVFNLN